MENELKEFEKMQAGRKEGWINALCWVCKLHQTRLTSDVIKTIIEELGYDPTERINHGK